MKIAKPSIPTTKPPSSADQLEQLREQTPTGTVEKMTDLERHVAGFADLPLSREKGAAVVTASSTQEVLEALGIRVESTGTFDLAARTNRQGGNILTGLFANRQGHPDYVETARLAEVGVRATREGVLADTGMFEQSGMLNPERAAQWWHETSGGKGYMTLEDIRGYVDGPALDLGLISLKRPGKAFNELEFHLLFDIAAVVDDKGQRVLTPDRFLAFLDGSLWRDLAKARAEGTLYEPTKVGVAVHESTKKVASELARLAARYGGIADTGTQALHQGQLTVDTTASLTYQQQQKALHPTIFGALRALCPVGGGSLAGAGTPAAARA